MNDKKFKNIITVVVAIAVMIGMVIPTVAMENTETAAEPLATEEVVEEKSVEPETTGNEGKPEDATAEPEEIGKTEHTADEETVTEEAQPSPAQEENQQKETQEIKGLLTPGFSPDALQNRNIIIPFDIIDPDETMIYPGVRVLWYDKNGSETSAPAGASITAVLMDKGPQDSYPDWVPSQNRLGTSKNTEVLNADNDFDGWFDNIIKMRSKKLVVSGVPDGYTVTYDDNRTSNEYPSGYDPEYFYINLTKTATTPAPELSNIEVTAPPAKTEYMVGETFDPTGLKVTAHYTNGGADKVLAAGAYTLSAPNMNTAGTKTVTVTYTEGSITKTTTFSIVVDSVPIVLSSIEVTTPPAKTVYTEGESFDKAGMVVTARYSDSSTAEVTGYTYSPTGMLSTSDSTVTISYEEGGVTKTASTPITVNAVPVTLSSIEVTTPPAKTVYTEGESFDKAGMVVTARYSDSSTAEVTGYTYSPTGMLSTSDSTVTISYEEGGVTKTASTPITVNAVPVTLSSIVVTTPPTKTEYAIGEIFDPTGMKVTAKYTNGGADRVLGTHEYTIDAVDTSTPGTKDVIIRHTDGGVEKTHHFTVTVAEALQPSPNPQPTEPTGTSDPQPTTSQPIEAGTQASDDNSSNTGEGEEIPKTGVDDIRPMMSIVFITAALALFILFMQVMKREKIRLQDFGKNGK